MKTIKGINAKTISLNKNNLTKKVDCLIMFVSCVYWSFAKTKLQISIDVYISSFGSRSLAMTCTVDKVWKLFAMSTNCRKMHKMRKSWWDMEGFALAYKIIQHPLCNRQINPPTPPPQLLNGYKKLRSWVSFGYNIVLIIVV